MSRWSGLLRQVLMARAVRGSNSIEGYQVSIEDAVAAGHGEDPLEAEVETWKAIKGYQSAMTYVVNLADDPHFRFTPELIRSLHYIMISHDLSKYPGRWRPGPVSVVDETKNEVVYRGPDSDLGPELMIELVQSLEQVEGRPTIIRAAMAHLNLAMIHPFKDGNGRMARCLQTLVLAREGVVHPVMSSIEEYLGKNTREYYDVLTEVGAGSWNPHRDPKPWIRFCITAHYRQAVTVEHRSKALQEIWDTLERDVASRGLPERSIFAVAEAAMGHKIRNPIYRAQADVSLTVATKDLMALVEAEMLIPQGEKRGRYYIAAPIYAELGRSYRNPPKVDDPFVNPPKARSTLLS